MPYRRISEVIGHRPFPTVHPETTVREAAIIMKEWKSSAVLVTLKNKLQQFQREQGLTPDGIAGSNTLLRLNMMAGEPMPKLEDDAQRASKPAKLDPAEEDTINTLSEEAS